MHLMNSRKNKFLRLIDVLLIIILFPQMSWELWQDGTLMGTAYQRFYTARKCLDTITGRELFVGDFFTRSGQCIRVQCLGTLEIWEDRCQVPKLVANCTQLPVANEYLDYPQCCPTYECRFFDIKHNSEIDTIQTYDHTGTLIKEHITQRILLILDHNKIQLT